MRLAEDEITITIGRETIHLRASLRAAYRLERRYGGFAEMAFEILNENIGVMADVIREGATEPTTIPALLDSLGEMPLRVGVETLREPLYRFTQALAGVDPDAKPAEDTRAQITFAEHHARLFRIGTGWLAWTPETTWDATPAEIVEAYKGRVEFLQAMFGGSPHETPTPEGNAFDPRGWTRLKAAAALGQNRSR